MYKCLLNPTHALTPHQRLLKHPCLCPCPCPHRAASSRATNPPPSLLATQYSLRTIGCTSHTIQTREQNLSNSKTAKVSAFGGAVTQIWKMPVLSQCFYKYLVMGVINFWNKQCRWWWTNSTTVLENLRIIHRLKNHVNIASTVPLVTN